MNSFNNQLTAEEIALLNERTGYDEFLRIEREILLMLERSSTKDCGTGTCS